MKRVVYKLLNKTPPALVACVSFYCCGAATAGLDHPGTWKSESDDGKYVFVMLSPLPIEKDIRYPEDEDIIRAIRSTYPESGLYLNDIGDKPLWGYDGPWLRNSIIIAPDGEHLILEGRWIWDEYAFDAVTFMRRGQKVRSYEDSESIPHWKLKFVLNGLTSPACAGTSFDPQQMTYAVRTNQGEEIVFDVKTGDIISIQSPYPLLYALALLFLLVLLGMVVAWWRSGRQRAVA